MDIFAWVGVGLAGSLILAYLLAWLVALIRSDMGRNILGGLLIVIVLAWGVVGFAWLVYTKVA